MIPTAKARFKTFVETVKSAMESNPLSINELESGFFSSLKISKSPGYDEKKINVVKKRFDELHDPLKLKICLVNEKKDFPSWFRNCKSHFCFKSGDSSKRGNYRPILVLPRFFRNTWVHYV